MDVFQPLNLTAFTISFYLTMHVLPIDPYQIACYGDDGKNCALSVVIHANMTLEISIASTRYVYRFSQGDYQYRLSHEWSGDISFITRGMILKLSQASEDNYDIVTRVIQLISLSQSCNNLFITYLWLYQPSNREITCIY